MARLPIVGGDDNTWGDVLNSYLQISLNGDGTLKTSAVSSSGASLPPSGAAGGDLTGTYPNPTVTATANFKTQVETVRLDQMAAPTASVSLNTQKITGLANGAAATDAAAFGQIPTSLPPSGAAGGDLTGTYPNPTLTGTANVESIISANATVTGKMTTSTYDPAAIAQQVLGTTASQAVSNKDLTSGTNTFPTFNQNTTGSAAKWTTPRLLAGNSVDGSANVAFANKFIVQGTADSGLSSAQFLGALSTGIMVVTTTTGVITSVAAPAGTIVGDTDTQTLTNKRITKRRLALSAGSATPAINTDNYDVVSITAQSAAITSFTTNLTGTPVGGDTLRINITDDGTGRAITWGASFESSTVALPTTTVANARLDVGFFWNTATSKWRCVAVA